LILSWWGPLLRQASLVFIETNNANDVVRDLNGNCIKLDKLHYDQDAAAGRKKVSEDTNDE
jgi:hypothetical protein